MWISRSIRAAQASSSLHKKLTMSNGDCQQNAHSGQSSFSSISARGSSDDAVDAIDAFHLSGRTAHC